MQTLDKKGDQLNPNITFDPETGMLSIRGKSIPINVDDFFADVITWIDQYAQNPVENTKLEIDLKYLNGSSLRTLVFLLSKLKAINENGNNVTVEWNVPREAEDLKMLSEQLLTELQLPHRIRMN